MRKRNIYSANLAICLGDSAIHYWQNHGVGPWASSLEYQVLCRSFVNISGFLWFVDMSDWNQLRESWKDTVYILPCQTFQQSRCFPLFFNISENSRHIDPLQKIMFFWLGIWQWHCHVLTHSKPPNWICEAKKNNSSMTPVWYDNDPWHPRAESDWWRYDILVSLHSVTHVSLHSYRHVLWYMFYILYAFL